MDSVSSVVERIKKARPTLLTEQRKLSGRYRITGHLARGGMANVYQAEDELLGRRVAIKILYPQFANDHAFVERFRREAQQAAGLNHPNIIAIYDWGEDSGTYYMVMELIEGKTIRDIQSSHGPFMPRRAAEIAIETAAALTVAHQAGVYHRDIKPGNVMLTANGSAKVTDFGIARALDDSAELTRTGAVIGTATYFSPEQAQGLSADERSDIYSLGVVLYEMLTGTAPFTGESPVAIAYQHVSEYAEPLSAINLDVPVELEAIVEKSMEKQPEMRYQKADDMRRDLLLYLSNEQPRVITTAVARGTTPADTHAIETPASPRTTPLPSDTASTDGDSPSITSSRLNLDGPTSYIAAALGLLLALVLGIYVLSRLLSTPPVQVTTLLEVPNLAQMSKEAAFEALQDLDLKVRDTSQFSDDVASGLVIETDPRAGTQIDPESWVTVVVSDGPRLFVIQNAIGSNENAARSLITAGHFTLGNVTYSFSDSVAKGLVISQSPVAGTNVESGTTIDLVVSNGPSFLTVPSVRMDTREAAQQALTSAGFTSILVESEPSEDVPEGLAVRTIPDAGQQTSPTGSITLVVSEGLPPFDLPDLVGMSVADAERDIRDLGLMFVEEEESEPVTAESMLDGLVAWQQPDDGTEVSVGDEVRIRLGELIQIKTPNVVGLTETEAEALLVKIGLSLVVTDTMEVSIDSGLDGLVASQDPADGAITGDGTVVEVTIGSAPPPPPPEEPPEEEDPLEEPPEEEDPLEEDPES